jgi:3-hydroxyisobutyrate dehydrogenase-like beta-hydroxyacid dehydrogenase
MSALPVGFIGLGDIGKPQACNLVAAELEAWVYDVRPEPVAELVALGAHAAATPANLAARCRVIGLCVRDDKDVENLLYGTEGLLAHAQAGTAIAIHSTVTQAALLRWAADAARSGVDLIDAPITRGRNSRSNEGRFACYMVGGDAAVLERCRPALETSAEEIVHAGPLGSGLALKLCNNLMTYLEFIAISEAAALAERAGLSFEVLARVGQANGVINERMMAFQGNRAALKLDEAAMQKFFGPFGRLGEKDLDAAIASAHALGLRLPATERAREIICDVFMGREQNA